MMLIGVALYRLGVLDGARSPGFYRRMSLIGLGAGLPLSALGLAIVASSGFSAEVALAGSAPSISPAPGFAIFVMAVWALQLWWSQAWLDRFRYGPVEWLWRCTTYRSWQRLRHRQFLSSPGLTRAAVGSTVGSWLIEGFQSLWTRRSHRRRSTSPSATE